MMTGARLGGAALILSSLGMVAGMAHHPSGPDAPFSASVHGFLILMLAFTAFGFACFVATRGAGRPALLAGAVAYGFALFGHLGAAMVGGFIAPALAARGDGIGPDLFLLTWEANQALAGLGVVGAAAAILLWSVHLLVRRDLESRALGAAGIVAGGLSAGLLLAGLIEMSIAGASLAYALHAAWAAALGIHMIRGRAPAPGERSGAPA